MKKENGKSKKVEKKKWWFQNEFLLVTLPLKQCFTLKEKILKENRDKISETEATALDAAIAKAKSALDGSTDTGELNSAIEDLTQASHKLAEVMYKQTAAGETTPGEDAQQAEQAAGSGKKEEEVIDAEYVDVDEEKKK